MQKPPWPRCAGPLRRRLGGWAGWCWPGRPGSAAAASRGEWSSAAARAGIWHKAGMVVVVCVAALTDLVLNVAVENLPAFGDGVGFDFEGVVLPVVLVWYIFTELGSIAENGAAMGAPVPSWLLSLLAESKEKAAK